MARTLVALALMPIACAYLIAAFIVWNLDASQWSEGTRGSVVFLAFFTEMIAWGVAGASGLFDRPRK